MWSEDGHYSIGSATDFLPLANLEPESTSILLGGLGVAACECLLLRLCALVQPPIFEDNSHVTADYASLIVASGASSLEQLVEFLQTELPHFWLVEYSATANRPTNVMLFRHGTFEYVYDHYAELEATGKVPYDVTAESRLVGACGISAPRPTARDDDRLRGWVGPTGRMFGAGWDKGHFIAHSIGGAVDGLEANVFVQSRALK